MSIASPQPAPAVQRQIKLPLSQQWKEAESFRVTVEGGQIVVAPVVAQLAKRTA